MEIIHETRANDVAGEEDQGVDTEEVIHRPGHEHAHGQALRHRLQENSDQCQLVYSVLHPPVNKLWSGLDNKVICKFAQIFSL